MDTILTLNIDKNVAKNAEIYAKYTQKTVSQLIEEYLLSISTEKKVFNDKSLGPITRQLAGIIKLDKNIDHKDTLTDALMEKFL
ncbi:MAG: DUF6364 family protein [Treponema sp.]|jgi:ethanolamine utilization protein EutA (predicted chaperonin)|nr:DUF6364 family protein [Treponema sp.]